MTGKKSAARGARSSLSLAIPASDNFHVVDYESKYFQIFMIRFHAGPSP